MNNINTLKVFCLFLYRDFRINFKKSHDFLINSFILFPLLFVIAFGYILPNTFFTKLPPGFAEAIFAGNGLLLLLNSSFTLLLNVLFDMEKTRFVQYQMSVLSARLVVLEYIIFTALFTFLLVVPFFPMAKLLLWNSFNISGTNWLMLYIVLLLSALLCSAYHMLAMCVLQSRQLSRLWARCTIPLFIVGGLWVPRYAMEQYSPLVGKLVLLNPFIYVTDGLRQAFVGGPLFLPLWHCAAGLLGFTALFTFLSFYFFKKRMDHV